MTHDNLPEKSIHYRRTVLEIIHRAQAGHTGGSLSCVDILNVLYNAVLRIDPAQPNHPDRDRYIQSKGHSVEALYTVLADRGFFPQQELQTLGACGSRLIGHPTRKVPGIEQNTGALGHGLSFGAGCALAARLNQAPFRVFVLLGDGEMAEGSNWEAAQFAAHHRLHNLIAIVDFNKLQISGPVSEVMGLEPLDEKWEAFGWDVAEVDGHDLQSLRGVLGSDRCGSKRPLAVIAHTIKGRGVSFMENNPSWHHRVPSPQELEAALQELQSLSR